MSTASKQVYTNSIFRKDSEYDELNTEYHKYDEINSVQTEDPSIDVHIALPNTAPRRAITRVCLIITFFFIAIVLTGVTTFIITKETLPETQIPDAEANSCYWSSWTSWSKCNVTCGNGTQIRLRLQNTTRLCSDSESYDSKTCSRSACADNAPSTPTASTESDIGIWSEWSQCTVTCGSGNRVRHRQCSTGTCNGNTRQTENCFTKCPLNNIWSEWLQWSQCTVTCGSGNRVRQRQCSIGTCSGDIRQTDQCFTKCPPNNTWSEWSQWSECVRERQCTGTCRGTRCEMKNCSPYCSAGRRRFKRSKRSVHQLRNNCNGQAPKVVYGIETGKSCNNLMICGDIARVDVKTVFADCCNVYITSPLVYMCICCPWVTAINPRQTELCTCTKKAMG